MTMQLQISPEVEAEITRQAALSGTAPEIYAADLLKKALNTPVPDHEIKSDLELTGTGMDIVRAMQRMPYKDEVDFDREPYYPPVREFVKF